MSKETDGKEEYDPEFTERDPLKEIVIEVNEKPKSFREKCSHVFNNVTLEPTMILFIVSAMISIITTQNLSLEKACRVDLNFTDEICSSLKRQDIVGQNQYERDTQKLLASAMAWKTYLTASIPCVMSLFVGSWSDITGHRKIFVIIPIIGNILVCINSMIHTYFFYQMGLKAFVFSEAIIEAFSGGWCITFLTIFAFISTITTVENRTFRMGLVHFCLTVSFPIGTGLSGIMLKKLGYYGCYATAASLQSVNLLYNVFVVKDPKRTAQQKKHDGKGVCHFFRTFFDFTNIKNTVQVVMKKTPDNRRLRLCILLLVVTILFGPMYGEISIMYMSTRYRFNWDEVKFSLFQTYNFITHTIGTIFSITVFSKYLKWHDSILGIISTLSKIAASFVYCFAPNERIFFIAPLVEILNGTALLAMRSIVSKLVEPDELGKINSLFGLTENLMPLLYVPLYTQVYTATMETLPGFVFLMGALMTIPAVAVFFWLFYEHRKYVRKSKVPKTPVD
ncbi:lysosomal proton-coupled steroid conjugate and bile acid symporter SLC46A3 isoform X1 [Amyelois transitella]|uniref:lysosomal proton-coupled steroid conjugate and bile acid symporter SLC46A3 isoform X1 n=1 Tax=Amyelois transitella TaxID=680683 RepID=UPI00298FCDCD|nr:lysosomal proton-coupled steroid conjugate and bile acid symporter SLC46A3 isoform X1 [Amyelois transitella]